MAYCLEYFMNLAPENESQKSEFALYGSTIGFLKAHTYQRVLRLVPFSHMSFFISYSSLKFSFKTPSAVEITDQSFEAGVVKCKYVYHLFFQTHSYMCQLFVCRMARYLRETGLARYKRFSDVIKITQNKRW